MEKQVRHIQFPIVYNRLIQCLLGQRNRFRFTLDKQTRLHGTVINDCVTAFLRLPYLDCLLYGNERSGIAQLLHQTVKQLLAYPFFRCEPHPTVAEVTEDLLFVVLKTGLQNRPLRC